MFKRVKNIIVLLGCLISVAVVTGVCGVIIVYEPDLSGTSVPTYEKVEENEIFFKPSKSETKESDYLAASENSEYKGGVNASLKTASPGKRWRRTTEHACPHIQESASECVQELALKATQNPIFKDKIAEEARVDESSCKNSSAILPLLSPELDIPLKDLKGDLQTNLKKGFLKTPPQIKTEQTEQTEQNKNKDPKTSETRSYTTQEAIGSAALDKPVLEDTSHKDLENSSPPLLSPKTDVPLKDLKGGFQMKLLKRVSFKTTPQIKTEQTEQNKNKDSKTSETCSCKTQEAIGSAALDKPFLEDTLHKGLKNSSLQEKSYKKSRSNETLTFLNTPRNLLPSSSYEDKNIFLPARSLRRSCKFRRRRLGIGINNGKPLRIGKITRGSLSVKSDVETAPNELIFLPSEVNKRAASCGEASSSTQRKQSGPQSGPTK